jgi:3-hydroxyacyl-CoA dehydrogenase
LREQVSNLVATELQDNIAVIVVNNPPVNALSAGVPDGIAQAIEAAEADANVSAVVLLGAGKTFIAGADIKQLEEMAWGKGPGAPNMHALLNKGYQPGRHRRGYGGYPAQL